LRIRSALRPAIAGRPLAPAAVAPVLSWAAFAASAAALAWPTAAWGQQRQPGSGGHMMWGGDHMWGMGWGGIVWILFLLVLIAAVSAAVALMTVRWYGGAGQGFRPGSGRDRETPPQGPEGRGEAQPIDILRARFARGEIDRAEFEARKRALEE
jgi:putative membrane protein